MASLLSARRTGSDITLQATDARRPDAEPPPDPQPALPVGWILLAIAGGLAAAAASWILSAGLTVVGWLAADPGTLGEALDIGTRIWLLGNGVSARIGDIPVTLVPWGATALSAFMLSMFAAAATRRMRDDEAVGPGLIGAATTGAYLVPVLMVAVFMGEPWQQPGHWAAVVAVLTGSAYLGGSRALGGGLTDALPGWLRSVPRAVVGAQLVMLAAGAAVLLTGLLRHLDRVQALFEALGPGVAGGIALLMIQLAFVPNAFVWSASYALGGGFSLGTGSVVAPAGTELGILPGIPMLGALPVSGPGSVAQLWWLGAGVLAGAVAAWIVVRSRPAARFDETSLVGGLAGVLSGLLFTGLAWAASGDLGTLRLADLGPRLLPLLIMGVTTMGLAGMITGLLLGIGRRLRTR
jgi:Family of unknown function (DUF6350)